jgi:hypothetical protein
MTDRLTGDLKKWRLRTVYGDDDDLVFAHPEVGVPLDRTKVTRKFQEACAYSSASSPKKCTGGSSGPPVPLPFDHELVKRVTNGVVNVSPEDVEDACAHAWIQFFRYQPDRDREWKGWLYRTAQREAWRLKRARAPEPGAAHRLARRGARAGQDVGAAGPS